MLGPKIKINSELMKKIQQAAELAMCSSADEWAIQILEREASKVILDAGKGDLSDKDVDDITKKLQGLGYLD
jgi:uncharacterized protein (DUF1778 family)